MTEGLEALIEDARKNKVLKLMDMYGTDKFVWATADEIKKYLRKGYALTNPKLWKK